MKLIRFLLMTLTLILAWGLVLATPTLLPAQQPQPQPPAAPDPSAPQLTHDERMKFFDWDDQKREIVDKLQKQYLAEVAPIEKAEEEYKRKLETATPGWMLQPGPQGWQWAKVPKIPPAEAKKPAAAAAEPKK